MPKQKKYLYCKKCKKYPDNVVEEGGSITRRRWGGECYEGYDTEWPTEGTMYCAKCDSLLIDKS